MRRTVAILITLAAALAIAPSALASPWKRNCGTSRDGFLLGMADPNQNYETPYEVSGPFHINMTRGEAIRLARRHPVEEFGYHVKPSEIPCLVATGVASSAAHAWLGWSGNDGWSNVTAPGYTTEYIGLFYCVGNPNVAPPGVVNETCTMKYRGGRIIGLFTISNNPNYVSASG